MCLDIVTQRNESNQATEVVVELEKKAVVSKSFVFTTWIYEFHNTYLKYY